MHEDQEEHTHETEEGASIGPTTGEVQVLINLRKAVAAVAVEANAIMEGRYKSIALTHLETAELFFGRAIEHDGIK